MVKTYSSNQLKNELVRVEKDVQTLRKDLEENAQARKTYINSIFGARMQHAADRSEKLKKVKGKLLSNDIMTFIFVILFFVGIMLSLFGIHMFYEGMHNMDIGQNLAFMQEHFNVPMQDLTTNYKTVDANTLYIDGMNKLQTSLYCVIMGVSLFWIYLTAIFELIAKAKDLQYERKKIEGEA